MSHSYLHSSVGHTIRTHLIASHGNGLGISLYGVQYVVDATETPSAGVLRCLLNDLFKDLGNESIVITTVRGAPEDSGVSFYLIGQWESNHDMLVDAGETTPAVCIWKGHCEDHMLYPYAKTPQGNPSVHIPTGFPNPVSIGGVTHWAQPYIIDNT